MLPTRNRLAKSADGATSTNEGKNDRKSGPNSIMQELNTKLSVRFADQVEIKSNKEELYSLDIVKNTGASSSIVNQSSRIIAPSPVNDTHISNNRLREQNRQPSTLLEEMENRQRNFSSQDKNRNSSVMKNSTNSEQNASNKLLHSGSNYRILYPTMEQRNIFVERSQTPNPTFIDSSYSRRCHTPSGCDEHYHSQNRAENNDRRPMSRSRQAFPDTGRNYDEYHLPTIDSRCSRNQEARSVTSRPSTVVLPPIDNSSNKSVLEAVKIFEQNNSRQTRNQEMSSCVGSCQTEARKFGTVEEEPVEIHPSDDCPTRIRKIRKTLQRFDRDAVPYERCTTIDGKSEAEDTPHSHLRPSCPHTFQSMREEENIQNKEIDRSSLIRVTRFRANKPTKKPSKTKRYETKESSPSMELVHDYNESDDSKVIQKPDWVIRSVEAGSPVQSSVRETWDSVNYQMRIKLKGNHYDYDESNVNKHTPME